MDYVAAIRFYTVSRVALSFRSKELRVYFAGEDFTGPEETDVRVFDSPGFHPFRLGTVTRVHTGIEIHIGIENMRQIAL